MRQKLRQGARRLPRDSTAAERRPVRVGAIPWALNLAPVLDGLANHAGPDGRRQSCHARWLAPVPVHLRHRYTAVTECKVTNLVGGHESRLSPTRRSWS